MEHYPLGKDSSSSIKQEKTKSSAHSAVREQNHHQEVPKIAASYSSSSDMALSAIELKYEFNGNEDLCQRNIKENQTQIEQLYNNDNVNYVPSEFNRLEEKLLKHALSHEEQIKMYKQQIDILKNYVKTLQNGSNILLFNNKSNVESLQQITNELKSEKSNLRQIKRERDDLRNEINRLNNHIKETDDELNVIIEERSILQKRLSCYNEVDEKMIKLSSLVKDTDLLMEERDSLLIQLNLSKSENESLREEKSLLNCSIRIISNERDKLLARLQQYQYLEVELDVIRNYYEHLKALTMERDLYKARYQELYRKYKTIEMQLSETEYALFSQTCDIKELTTTIERLSVEKEQFRQSVFEISAQLTQISNELCLCRNELKNIKSNFSTKLEIYKYLSTEVDKWTLSHTPMMRNEAKNTGIMNYVSEIFERFTKNNHTYSTHHSGSVKLSAASLQDNPEEFRKFTKNVSTQISCMHTSMCTIENDLSEVNSGTNEAVIKDATAASSCTKYKRKPKENHVHFPKENKIMNNISKVTIIKIENVSKKLLQSSIILGRILHLLKATGNENKNLNGETVSAELHFKKVKKYRLMSVQSKVMGIDDIRYVKTDTEVEFVKHKKEYIRQINELETAMLHPKQALIVEVYQVVIIELDIAQVAQIFRTQPFAANFIESFSIQLDKWNIPEKICIKITKTDTIDKVTLALSAKLQIDQASAMTVDIIDVEASQLDEKEVLQIQDGIIKIEENSADFQMNTVLRQQKGIDIYEGRYEPERSVHLEKYQVKHISSDNAVIIKEGSCREDICQTHCMFPLSQDVGFIHEPIEEDTDKNYYEELVDRRIDNEDHKKTCKKPNYITYDLLRGISDLQKQLQKVFNQSMVPQTDLENIQQSTEFKTQLNHLINQLSVGDTRNNTLEDQLKKCQERAIKCELRLKSALNIEENCSLRRMQDLVAASKMINELINANTRLIAEKENLVNDLDSLSARLLELENPLKDTLGNCINESLAASKKQYEMKIKLMEKTFAKNLDDAKVKYNNLIELQKKFKNDMAAFKTERESYIDNIRNMHEEILQKTIKNHNIRISNIMTEKDTLEEELCIVKKYLCNLEKANQELTRKLGTSKSGNISSKQSRKRSICENTRYEKDAKVLGTTEILDVILNKIYSGGLESLSLKELIVLQNRIWVATEKLKSSTFGPFPRNVRSCYGSNSVTTKTGNLKLKSSCRERMTVKIVNDRNLTRHMSRSSYRQILREQQITLEQLDSAEHKLKENTACIEEIREIKSNTPDHQKCEKNVQRKICNYCKYVPPVELEIDKIYRCKCDMEPLRHQNKKIMEKEVRHYNSIDSMLSSRYQIQ